MSMGTRTRDSDANFTALAKCIYTVEISHAYQAQRYMA